MKIKTQGFREIEDERYNNKTLKRITKKCTCKFKD